MNPVRAYRLDCRQTLEQFAENVGIGLQAVYLTEQGCYSDILPRILKFMGHSHNSIYNDEYHLFQEQKRHASGLQLHLNEVELWPPGDPHPVADLRAHIGIAYGHPAGLSRMGFAKMFCIQSAEMYYLEEHLKPSLSEQFKLAMRQSGLNDTVLSELEYRVREAAGGV